MALNATICTCIFLSLTMVPMTLGFNLDTVDLVAMINSLRSAIEALVGMLYVTGASTKCTRSLQMLVRHIFHGDTWALYMLDAMAKPEPGILQGSFTSIGSQTECHKIHARLNLTGLDKNSRVWKVDSIIGRYCGVRYSVDLAGILDLAFSNNATSSTYRSLINGLLGKDRYLLREVDKVVEDFPGFFGLCVPSTCTQHDMQEVFNFVHPLFKAFLNINVSTNVVSCKTKPEADKMEWTPTVLASLSVLAVLLALVCIGTLLSLTDCNKAPSSTQEALKRSGSTSSVIGDLLRCFSVTKNLGQLFAMEEDPSRFQCIHGLRALSVVWVILGHILLLHSMMLTKNLILLKDKMKDITLQFMINFTPGADTLLCLVGMMVAYVPLTKLHEENQLRTKGFLAKYLLHRFIRMSPLFLLTTLLVAPLFPHIARGPTWDIESARLVSHCPETWWWNLLHINNFLSRSEQCMEHGWFFALLVQCTIVAILIVPVWYHRPAAGNLLALALVVATVILTSVITFLFDLGPTWLLREYRPGSRNEYIQMIYIPIYTRGGVFFTGMIAGYVLSQRRKVVLHKAVVLVSWVACLSTIFWIIHMPFMWNRGLDLPDNQASAAYGGLSRVAWSAAISWTVVACVSGYGGWLNSLLSLKIWLPVSRLLYSWYIVSPFVIIYSNGVREHSFFLSYDAMSYVLVHHLVFSSAFAVVASLCFELPFLKIEEVVTKKLEPLSDVQDIVLQVPRVKPFWLEQGNNTGYVKEHL